MGGGDPLPQCLSRTGQRVWPCLAMFGLAFENQPFQSFHLQFVSSHTAGFRLEKGQNYAISQECLMHPYATND